MNPEQRAMRNLVWSFAAVVVLSHGAAVADQFKERFDGNFFSGAGDVEYLQLLDISARMFASDPEFQNMPMLYEPAWNGLVEGPTWNGWWIQNSYGPTYCALPFLQEPFVTFLQNSQNLWFDKMGDGKRMGDNNWIGPDGCLCDMAAPGRIYYKQGDGATNIHDWGVEFTAAGVVLQAELLLISRDMGAIGRYLPKLERSANFIETRRDPTNNLFLAGPAGNLLAPSYAGWKRPDGRFEKAYLAGLSITYIAALDRLIELEKLAGRLDKVALYTERRDLARKGLPLLTTDEGYFIKYLDPDGTRHGIHGAPKHGYFEAVCNHDAICFRVANDAQAEKIFAKIASLPGLRRHDLIITNDPSLDDTYHPPVGLWTFGHWVNGGHWTTCEARMMMGYSRLGKYDDARRSMRKILEFARKFRMDNNLTDFGAAVYQPNQPINLCYDTFGAPAAMIRGMFEYLYRADELTILPHIPHGITRLEQRFPIRFGQKELYISTCGNGPVTAVAINGRPWKSFTATTISLPYDQTPDVARIQIAFGGTALGEAPRVEKLGPPSAVLSADDAFWGGDWLMPKEIPLRIGADSTGQNRFVGDMRRVRVFSRALEAKEIATLAQHDDASLVKDPALVGDWVFDVIEDRAFANRASSGQPAKVVESLTIADDQEGTVVRMDGRGYLEVADAPALHLAKAYTLEAWIRPRKLPDNGARIIDKATVGTADNYLLDTYPGNSLRLITRSGVLSCDAKLPPDRWSHVAATCEAGGKLCLYLNGKQVASRQADAPAASSTAVAEVSPAGLRLSLERIGRLHARLVDAELAESYEAAHARLALDYLATIQVRGGLKAGGKLSPLPPASQAAADKSYTDTLVKLIDGLERVLRSYKDATDPHRAQVYRFWAETAD